MYNGVYTSHGTREACRVCYPLLMYPGGMLGVLNLSFMYPGGMLGVLHLSSHVPGGMLGVLYSLPLPVSLLG